jgi:hypothetical protein
LDSRDGSSDFAHRHGDEFMPPSAEMMSDNARSWALLVTDGTVIEFAPELYPSREEAHLEARRWAWVLSAGTDIEVLRPFQDRLEVGIHDVRVVEVEQPGGTSRPWIGTFWTSDGYPEPEAVVFRDRSDAEQWVLSPLDGIPPESVNRSPWHVSATFLVRGEEAYAVAHLAKVVCPSGL